MRHVVLWGFVFLWLFFSLKINSYRTNLDNPLPVPPGAFSGNFFLILSYHREQRAHPLCPRGSGRHFSLWTQRSHRLPPPSSPTSVWSLRSELHCWPSPRQSLLLLASRLVSVSFRGLDFLRKAIAFLSFIYLETRFTFNLLCSCGWLWTPASTLCVRAPSLPDSFSNY